MERFPFRTGLSRSVVGTYGLSRPTEQSLVLDRSEVLSFCGRNDRKIRRLQTGLKAEILTRGTEIVALGEAQDVERAMQALRELLAVQRQSGQPLTDQQLDQAIQALQDDEEPAGGLSSVFLDRIALPRASRHVAPLTRGQKRYIDAIRHADIVMSTGPAGTGKTYLAVAMAVWHLAQGVVRRIVLVRPAVEAGERLGFLPGDIAAKFDPFVRPLYDALYDMMDPEKVKDYLETGIIEIAPLAFMRGRTLNESFVILDEGQNTTVEQMKMFLTRLGVNSRAVVTGDITQIDLPEGKTSGLVHAQKVLREITGIEFVRFSERDVVRHALVQKIVRAYERAGKRP
ncbi:PhoH family protein [Candidatus Sumerlaeota bacterium]|nr:PhoH family protein [Candidatus Sumerlaeota bacterium]